MVSGPGKVTLTCGHAKLTPARVAQEAVELLVSEMLMNQKSEFHSLMLTPRVVKGTVRVRLCCGEKKWEAFAGEAKALFARKGSEGNMAAKAVGPAEARQMKGPKEAVAVSFVTTVEPPLLDIGGGHMVACYLFKAPAK
jgi:hypothetical protein